MTVSGQSVGAAMREAARRLTREGVPDAASDVRWLMAEALGIGTGRATVWTCDLTHGYISINADYRS